MTTFAAGIDTSVVSIAAGLAGRDTVGRVKAITTVAMTKTKKADPATIQFNCLSVTTANS